MRPRKIRVAIFEPDDIAEPVRISNHASIEIAMRASLTPDHLDRLENLGVTVVVIDLRGICTTEIGACMRLVRTAAPQVRIVAVTAPNDDAGAQFSIASGAVAHLGQNLNPLSLLGAVTAAARGASTHGETGKRAIRRMQFDAP